MTSSGFFDQFIEDYFAECDEHLATMRRVLLALDDGAGRAHPEGAQLQELHRTLHTLKGLSGMVGLTAAERIAHAMEDVLRAHGSVDATVDPRLVEALFAGARQLERSIAARREGTEVPSADEFLAELEATFPAIDSTGPEISSAALETPAPTPAETAYRFEFVPSAELAQRGVGVAAIRARLQALGQVLDARPRVLEAGGVAFDFSVAVPAGASPPPSWRDDGLTWSESDGREDEEPAEAPVHAGGRRHTPLPGPGASLSVVGSGSNHVRVELTRLDELMRLVGELVVSRARLADALGHADASGLRAARESLLETSATMERQLRSLRESVTRIRLVPVGEVFERMRFAVREVARDSGKQVTLELSGQDTEIDKLVVDRILEPLLHLVRNAVSHGIEGPEVRQARGKPPAGRLALRATASGDRVVIEVEDDGPGIDVERVTARARELEVLRDGDATLEPGVLLDLLCAPGFSTRDEADLASGRGVGMDVVRSTVRGLGGRLALDTTVGRGTRFTIELPLTLMIMDALLVDIGGQRMAVPQPALREILQVEAATLTVLENNEVLSYRGGVLPLVNLGRLFGIEVPRRDVLYVLVVGTETQHAGLLVDRIFGLREIVVHPLPDPLVAVPGISGATEMGDGRVSLILDAAALVRIARDRRAQPLRHGSVPRSDATLIA